MKSPRANMRNFAECLIGLETKGGHSSAGKVPVAFLVCEILRQHLSLLMGNAGFRSLLSRALALTNAEDPRLHKVQLRADGTFEGFDQSDSPALTNEVAGGGVVLLAKLLGLLVAFIGEDLSLRLIRGIWPTLPADVLDIRGDKNEKKHYRGKT